MTLLPTQAAGNLFLVALLCLIISIVSSIAGSLYFVFWSGLAEMDGNSGIRRNVPRYFLLGVPPGMEDYVGLDQRNLYSCSAFEPPR